MDKDIYLDCKKLLKDFIKKEYWAKFTAADLFYIMSGKNRALFTFVDQFFGDAFGCQLFFNTDGLNYVHDILTSSNEETVTIYDCDSLCAALICRSELKEDEIKFLRDNKIRINENNNLIIYRYEAGYKQRIADNKDMSILLEYFELIASILNNEYEDIVYWFKENESIVCLMNKEKLEYEIIYRHLPYLEKKPRLLKANEGFIEEFRNCTYVNDECYLFASYLPVVIKESDIRPLVLYFYYPKLKKHQFKYIMNEPKEYKNILFSIIYDVFMEIGVPYKILFNNRNVHSILKKTINALHIEDSFTREDNNVDSNMNEIIAKVYQESSNEIVESEEFIHMLLNSIQATLNDLNLFDLDDSDEFESEDLIS